MERFVIDTSVLIYEPEILNKIKKGYIYIPLGVLEELDSLKNGDNKPSTQYAARVNIRGFSKIWDNPEMVYRNDNKTIAPLADPVRPDETTDNYLIRMAKKLNAKLLTMDLNLSIKARVQGVDSIMYQGEKHHTRDLYTGQRKIYAPRDILKDVWEGTPIIPADYPKLFKDLKGLR